MVKRMLLEFVMIQQPTLEQALKLPSVLTTQWGLMGPFHQQSTFPVCLQFKHLELSLVGHTGMTNYAWPSYSQLCYASFSSSYTICFGAIIPLQISFPFMQVSSHSLSRSTQLLLSTKATSPPLLHRIYLIVGLSLSQEFYETQYKIPATPSSHYLNRDDKYVNFFPFQGRLPHLFPSSYIPCSFTTIISNIFLLDSQKANVKLKT